MARKKKYLRGSCGSEKNWRFRFARSITDSDGSSLDGLCLHEEKLIKVVRDVDELSELETCVHELLHAQMKFLDEHCVTQNAAQLASWLWRLGYRRNMQESEIS